MTDAKLTIEALRVLTDLGGFKPDGEYVRPGTRFATTDDLIAVLEGLGAEKWMWCVTHEESSESGLFCAQGVVYQRKFDCRMVDVLVWRIE